MMLILNRAEVESAIDVPDLVEALAGAMRDLSGGAASMPPRMAAMVPDRDGMLASMPAHLPSAGALTAKLVSLFPRNREQPTHQAVICCFDPVSGSPLALMDGTAITAMRTAAGSSLATRLLARRGNAVAAVIGTGVQARSHVAVLASMGQVSTVLLAGRQQRETEVVAEQLADQHRLPVSATRSPRDAIAQADIVCATTSASAPVVTRDAIRPGTHINSVGYNPAGAGEVDAATIRDALVVVESRATALAPPPTGAVELHRAIAANVITPDHIHAEVGELLIDACLGRTDDEQITLYKSVGVAVQDAAAAAMVLAAARVRGIGTDVEV